MATPFVGQIEIVAFNFAPRGFAACNGQILAISQNTALFSILGTTYGGNGTSNFALPNLQGSAPIHTGQSPGTSQYVLGETTGSPTVTLLQGQLPIHIHAAQSETVGGVSSPANADWGGGGRGKPAAYTTAASLVSMNPAALGAAGSGQPHNNLSPFLGLFFCIALQGVFPARN